MLEHEHQEIGQMSLYNIEKTENRLGCCSKKEYLELVFLKNRVRQSKTVGQSLPAETLNSSYPISQFVEIHSKSVFSNYIYVEMTFSILNK